jgi:MAX-like protein X
MSTELNDYNTIQNTNQDQKSKNQIDKRRKMAHTQAEKKRRDSIRKGYDDLQTMVPSCQSTDPLNTTKMSKATILSKTIEYIEGLSNERENDENELISLRREVKGLQIMLDTYSTQMKKARHTNHYQSSYSSDSVKLETYKSISHELFATFDREVELSSFQTLTQSMFEWTENYCTQQNIQKLVDSAVSQELKYQERDKREKINDFSSHTYQNRPNTSNYNHY